MAGCAIDSTTNHGAQIGRWFHSRHYPLPVRLISFFFPSLLFSSPVPDKKRPVSRKQETGLFQKDSIWTCTVSSAARRSFQITFSKGPVALCLLITQDLPFRKRKLLYQRTNSYIRQKYITDPQIYQGKYFIASFMPDLSVQLVL